MRRVFWAVVLFCSSGAYASTELTAAINNVRRNCGSISDELADMKTMAGINTAVTSVGTVAGGVAVGTGVAKANVDKEIAVWEQKLQEMIEKQRAENGVTQRISDAELNQALAEVMQDPQNKQAKEALDTLNKKSKTLGDVRTGTLATNMATNIAGAAIAGTNRIRGDLQSQIDACIADVDALSRALGQARVSGDASDAEIAHVQKIVTECGMWGTVNLASINKRATGAAVSSGIGAGVGLAGTITSALANSHPVPGADDKKEKNMNTAANVLAGGATVASATAIIFNATQISAIKRAADVADKCEEALK